MGRGAGWLDVAKEEEAERAAKRAAGRLAAKGGEGGWAGADEMSVRRSSPECRAADAPRRSDSRSRAGKDEARTAGTAEEQRAPALPGESPATMSMLPGAYRATGRESQSSIMASASSSDSVAAKQVEADEAACKKQSASAAAFFSPGGPGPVTKEVATMTILIPRPGPRERRRSAGRRREL